MATPGARIRAERAGDRTAYLKLRIPASPPASSTNMALVKSRLPRFLAGPLSFSGLELSNEAEASALGSALSALSALSDCRPWELRLERARLCRRRSGCPAKAHRGAESTLLRVVALGEDDVLLDDGLELRPQDEDQPHLATSGFALLERAESTPATPACCSAFLTPVSVALRPLGVESASASDPLTPCAASAAVRSVASCTARPDGIDCAKSPRTTSVSAPSATMTTPLVFAAKTMLATSNVASAVSQDRVFLFHTHLGGIPTT